MHNNGGLGKIKTVLSPHSLISYILLLISIITFILLSSKNIATFSYYEEDYPSLYFTDYVVLIDGNGRIWCNCNQTERSSCKKIGPLTFRECPPNLSLKVGNSDIPILIAPQIGASAGLLLKLYIKILEKIKIKKENMPMKQRIILFRSFGIIVNIILRIILIFFITSKIFGHPAAGISSALLSTNMFFIFIFSSFSNTIFLTDYLPVIVLLTISLAASIVISKIKLKTKTILISIFFLTLLLSPFLLYQIKYLEDWSTFKLWASPLKYAYYRLISSPENFAKNLLTTLTFTFGNRLPDDKMGWWSLKCSAQDHTFEIIRGILISIGFLTFILSEKNSKTKYFLISLIFSYAFLLSLFDISAHHYIAPSFMLYIACSKGIAEFKSRPWSIPLYIPLVFLLISSSVIGFIINNKKIIESNPDKLLEPKLQLVEFLKKNNIKRVVEIGPDHHIPIGILTDGEIKVVSYSLVLLKSLGKSSNDKTSLTEIIGKILSLERNSIFIHGNYYSPDDFYNFAKFLGFEVKELFRISVGQYYLIVFTVE